MASNSIYENSLLPNVRPGREGVQCERSLRALLLVFDSWSRFKVGDTVPSKPRSLSAIPFDKLAMFVFRLWTQAFQDQGNRPETENLDLGVSFPAPFRAIPGKHGRGPGRWEGPGHGAPTYLLDMLFNLQSEGLLHYFRLTPPTYDRANPANYKTTIFPALPVADAGDFLRGFNHVEQKFLRELQGALKRLEPQELRSLGTHADRKTTIEDIKRELKYINKLKPDVIRALKDGALFVPAARLLVEYGDEAWRKAHSNKDSYAKAYKDVLREISDADLASVFRNCQKPVDEIWDGSPALQTLTAKAKMARHFTRYLHTLARYQQKISQGSPNATRRYKRLWNDSVAGLAECGVTALPRIAEEAFVRNSYQFTPEVRRLLIQTLDSL